tara:strand:- start:422 stop:592 length:171 start_codon:yes stop_codon:yes gene_type:complete
VAVVLVLLVHLAQERLVRIQHLDLFLNLPIFLLTVAAVVLLPLIQELMVVLVVAAL